MRSRRLPAAGGRIVFRRQLIRCSRADAAATSGVPLTAVLVAGSAVAGSAGDADRVVAGIEAVGRNEAGDTVPGGRAARPGAGFAAGCGAVLDVAVLDV